MIEALEMASEIPKNDILKIAENARANIAKLKSCERHDFSIDITPKKKIGKRWRCQNCGGDIDSINKSWYEKGLADAG